MKCPVCFRTIQSISYQLFWTNLNVDFLSPNSRKYATRSMYGYCPAFALDWDYRRKGIITEILMMELVHT